MHDKSDNRVVALIEEFLTARATRKPSPHTQAAYRRDLLAVAALAAELATPPLPLADLRIGALFPGLLRSAFARFAADRAAASVGRAWSTWNGFFSFLVAEQVVTGNPMPAVGRPRAPLPQPKPLRGEDTPELLLASAARGEGRQRDPWPERDVAVLALALCAGLRLSELLALRVGSLGGRPGERRLEVSGKGGRPRVMPVESDVDAVIGDYLDSRVRRFGSRTVRPDSALLVDRQGVPLRRGGLQYLVESCYRRAGIGDRVPRGARLHALRHTFATRLAEDGAGAAEIMRLLGHASLASSQTYIEVTAAQQREAVRANRTNRSVVRVAAGSGGSGVEDGR
ncbi:tyrosine-type recombinase/integrase [Micromonospora endophytica]|uniref:Integrase n=1 Tax=Micromonospora endophytica TaxID=515350 RepID=A0A2W2C1B0_9ACTN|nr:tyrosine-type recombinase/integrase [Micromonospora endophytica]PZF86544.1 integrase [Micromonospora endophytica]RIW49561.1 integrase [Micromonospora endophytica]BCJ62629.1 integrase [Micromonospora endophytica]